MVGPAHVIGDNTAGTSVDERLGARFGSCIEHILCSHDIGLPHFSLQPSAEPVGQGWDNPCCVDDHIRLNDFKCLVDLLSSSDIDLHE